VAARGGYQDNWSSSGYPLDVSAPDASWQYFLRLRGEERSLANVAVTLNDTRLGQADRP